MGSFPQGALGVAKRHDDWEEITEMSSVGRKTLDAVPTYRLLKAATRADASPQARLLLVHLLGYLGTDQTDDPTTRFIVFPGNTRLADELHYSPRSIQRLADELEEQGLLRRTYNGLNRRIGFDLTPLAMQQGAIEAAVVEIHTRRAEERQKQQLELSLAADLVRRPTAPQGRDLVASCSSPQGDNHDTQNRPSYPDSADPVLSILDGVDQSLTDRLSGRSDQEDRTGQDIAQAEAQVLRHLTGSGRAAHLGWALAKRTFGFERALALCAIAAEDPKRKASTDRYFGWLLRMAATHDAEAIIGAAAKRVADRAQAEKRAPDKLGGASVTPGAGEPLEMAETRALLRDQIGECDYLRWFGGVTLSGSREHLTITADSPFVIRQIEDRFGRTMVFALQAATGSQAIQVDYRVA